MLDTFIASTCLHPTDSTSVLPFSDSPIDFATPLCRSCQLSHEDAEAEGQLLEVASVFRVKPTMQMRKKVREARRKYTQKHLEVVRMREAEEEGERIFKDSLRYGEGGCEGREVGRRRVSWREGIEEREKRRQQEYTRASTEYVPGRWADGSGEGFWNTSDPFKEEAKAGDGEETGGHVKELVIGEEAQAETQKMECEAEKMEMVKVEEIVVDPQLLAEDADGTTYERLRAEAEEIEEKIKRLKEER